MSLVGAAGYGTRSSLPSILTHPVEQCPCRRVVAIQLLHRLPDLLSCFLLPLVPQSLCPVEGGIHWPPAVFAGQTAVARLTQFLLGQQHPRLLRLEVVETVDQLPPAAPGLFLLALLSQPQPFQVEPLRLADRAEAVDGSLGPVARFVF